MQVRDAAYTKSRSTGHLLMDILGAQYEDNKLPSDVDFNYLFIFSRLGLWVSHRVGPNWESRYETGWNLLAS